MSDRICPKCSTEFKYPSLLKNHFRKAYHCLLSEEEIYIFFNPIIFNDKQCNKCNKIFCQKSVMLRHQRETKCGRTQSNNTIPNTPILNIPNISNNESNQKIMIANLIKSINPDPNFAKDILSILIKNNDN